ncbi:hypothetical protein AZ78_1905 [Lysobacter capsici AZ78]|uniref:Uncharacterized protein n=1 Tax=Lysobacter capsici AZ78 TaxID=1444315 RepID=A0A120AGC3_9GAMM|nr:hypothetical protein [Lysobacter capsici]KWS04356.1 hypothetical protein AZ78_1905 [Lysobacter capsici AZ78]
MSRSEPKASGLSPPALYLRNASLFDKSATPATTFMRTAPWFKPRVDLSALSAPAR